MIGDLHGIGRLARQHHRGLAVGFRSYEGLDRVGDGSALDRRMEAQRVAWRDEPQTRQPVGGVLCRWPVEAGQTGDVSQRRAWTENRQGAGESRLVRRQPP